MRWEPSHEPSQGVTPAREAEDLREFTPDALVGAGRAAGREATARRAVGEAGSGRIVTEGNEENGEEPRNMQNTRKESTNSTNFRESGRSPSLPFNAIPRFVPIRENECLKALTKPRPSAQILP
jgi:hypothetical protein